MHVFVFSCCSLDVHNMDTCPVDIMGLPGLDEDVVSIISDDEDAGLADLGDASVHTRAYSPTGDDEARPEAGLGVF